MHILLDMTLGERALYGLQVFVIGIVTVFAVLAILWGVMSLFRLFFYTIPQKKKAVKVDAPRPIEPFDDVPEPHQIPLATAQGGETDDKLLVAILTAAVAAYEGDGTTAPTGSFRVVSYRRAYGSAGWNRTEDNEF